MEIILEFVLTTFILEKKNVKFVMKKTLDFVMTKWINYEKNEELIKTGLQLNILN